MEPMLFTSSGDTTQKSATPARSGRLPPCRALKISVDTTQKGLDVPTFSGQPMFCHGLCHWYSQSTPESYVIDTPANVGWCLISYIVDTSADTGWAEDLQCIQRAIQCPVGWHSDCLVCIGVYCWTRKLCYVAFQRYNMHPCTLCRP